MTRETEAAVKKIEGSLAAIRDAFPPTLVGVFDDLAAGIRQLAESVDPYTDADK